MFQESKVTLEKVSGDDSDTMEGTASEYVFDVGVASILVVVVLVLAVLREELTRVGWGRKEC